MACKVFRAIISHKNRLFSFLFLVTGVVQKENDIYHFSLIFIRQHPSFMTRLPLSPKSFRNNIPRTFISEGKWIRYGLISDLSGGTLVSEWQWMTHFSKENQMTFISKRGLDFSLICFRFMAFLSL